MGNVELFLDDVLPAQRRIAEVELRAFLTRPGITGLCATVVASDLLAALRRLQPIEILELSPIGGQQGLQGLGKTFVVRTPRGIEYLIAINPDFAPDAFEDWQTTESLCR